MNAELPPNSLSRIRTKTNVEVEIILIDGTTLAGSVFIGLGERVQDLLNDGNRFFPLRMHNKDLLLVAKAQVAVCKPLDTR